MKQYSIYDNFTGSFLTHVMARDEIHAHALGTAYGRDQAYDLKEFCGVSVITHPQAS